MKEPKMGFEHEAGQHQAGLGDSLWEAHAAASKILEFTAGQTFEDYQQHEVLRAAVESMLQILVASLEDVQEYFPAEAAKLERAGEAIALRAKLNTGADADIWNFAQHTLPMLLAELTVSLEDWHSA